MTQPQPSSSLKQKMAELVKALAPPRATEGEPLEVRLALRNLAPVPLVCPAPPPGVSPTTVLLRVTREALYAGIAQANPGRRVGDVSHAVQACVEGNGFSVVRSLVGHGIGRSMHEDPQVPNYGHPDEGPELRPGMVLAIEPMVNAGGSEVEVLADEWTVVTCDGSLSAHFEHSVAITDDGPVILTNGAIE